jgi:tetratricopeptide (TPR) repeat protein
VGEADVGEEYRATARRNLAYHLARVALVRGDLETAAAKAEEYRATAKPDLPVEAGRSHELAGRIALERGDPETALRELSEADQEDPRILYFQALAWRARGDREKTRELAKRAADYNDLDVGYALVRGRAQRLLAE